MYNETSILWAPTYDAREFIQDMFIELYARDMSHSSAEVNFQTEWSGQFRQYTYIRIWTNLEKLRLEIFFVGCVLFQLLCVLLYICYLVKLSIA